MVDEKFDLTCYLFILKHTFLACVKTNKTKKSNINLSKRICKKKTFLGSKPNNFNNKDNAKFYLKLLKILICIVKSVTIDFKFIRIYCGIKICFMNLFISLIPLKIKQIICT